MGLLDIIFPKRCVNCRAVGSYICEDCFSFINYLDSGTCFVCQRPSINFLTHLGCSKKATIDGVFSIVSYTGVIRKLVFKFKYDPYLSDLKNSVSELIYEGIIQIEPLYKLLDQKLILVPIPLYKLRYLKRGYNQSEILAKGISEKLNIPVVTLLKRLKNTKRQVGLSKKQRTENMKNAFSIDEHMRKIHAKTNIIFLIDDVVTSGATMKEAAQLLKKNGFNKVYGLTLAHGE